MEKQLTIDEFNELLGRHASHFIGDIVISKEQEHGLRGEMMKDHPTFPSFPIFDDSFYRQTYFNKYIENCLFSCLIRDLTIDLLNTKGINCEKLLKDEKNSIHQLAARSCNQPIDSDIDFIIHKDNINIGYIFEEKRKVHQSAKESLNDFNLSKVIYVSTYDSDKECSYRGLPNYIEHITHRKLFEECRESDKYDYYKEKVQDAIKFAVNYINYSSMPVLNNKYLFDFKKELENDLISMPIDNMSYYAIDKYNEQERMTLQAESLLLTNDNVKNVFIEKELYKTLLGKSDIAKSFITAEYLYKYLSKYNKVDYTAIGVCYIKSIEQLLKQIAFLSYDESDKINKYFMAVKNIGKSEFEKAKLLNEAREYKYYVNGMEKFQKEILFVKKYKYKFINKLVLENFYNFIDHNSC